ncbi:phosphatase PAP2 family protein [Candidatus Woesearchaeota archaeon]|nr:phosphatase PAP2 family protein [Candidatus Woesearchaeota archaeon]
MDRSWKIFLIVALAWSLSYIISNAYVEKTAEGYINYHSSFDDLFPLIPFFVIIYISAYALFFLPLFFEQEFKPYVFGLLSLAGITLLIFTIFPGIITRPQLGTDIFSKILAWIYSIDNPHNLFPSSHVSLSFFSACIMNNKWIYFWFALIAISTLLIKQHYIVDVIGGIAVGGLAYAIYRTQKKKVQGAK